MINSERLEPVLMHSPPEDISGSDSEAEDDQGGDPLPVGIPVSGASKKIVYFIRHAEAVHNVREREAVAAAIAAGVTEKTDQEEARRAVLKHDPSLRDAPLSADGISQVQASGRRLGALFHMQAQSPMRDRSNSNSSALSGGTTSADASSVFRRPDVVLVSPLRRALMTATELFLNSAQDDQDPHAGRNTPKFIAVEALREKRTGMACDERSSVVELRKEFPHVDFSDIERGLPAVPMGEDNEAVRARGRIYLDQRLQHVEGSHLAIVSHKGWLREFRKTLKSRLDSGCLRADFDVESWDKTLYGNAEVRVAAFKWLDGVLSSVVSRSVDNAMALASAAGMMTDGFEFALGPPSTGFSIFLAKRTIKVHFISVSEGKHNVAVRRIIRDRIEGTASHEAVRIATNEAEVSLLREDGVDVSAHHLHDARLSRRGRKQASALKELLAKRPSGGRPFTAFDLVVTSPLTRACETAQIVFGDTPGTYGGEVISPPRIVVREECRERFGKYVCDSRRTGTLLQEEFPSFDFISLDADADILHGDERESFVDVQDRALRLLQWLSARPERCVAVVTHSELLTHLFGQFGDTLHEEDRTMLQRTAVNCELRSVVLCSHQPVERESNDAPASTIRVPSCSSVSSLTSLS